MNELIYFPSFEPQNQKWLKFSLLYLDEFRPIIPESGRNDISDMYREIYNETDLINPFSPQYIHGENASLKSIEELDKIFQYPKRYRRQFSNINNWKNQNTWNYLIYSEKFSYVFKDYCIQNNLGEENSNGILVSEEIGYIFMQNLANEISNKTNSSIITDSRKFHNYDTYKSIIDTDTISIQQLAESTINLKIPMNMEEINLSNIIKFRNEHKDLIKEFQLSLEKIRNKVDDISALKFLGEFDSIYSKSMKDITLTSLGLGSTLFSIYSLYETNTLDVEELVGIGGGLSATYYGVKEIITETNNKRQCVKYFANLKELQ